MNRLMLLLFAFLIAGMPTHLRAQTLDPVSVDELGATLQDDHRFAKLMTEIWVLRDLLALQQGGDIAAETKEFQGLQDQLRSHSASIASTLSAEPARVSLPVDVQNSAKAIAASLDGFGVRADSELGKRLLAAYLAFSQTLSAASLEPLCSIYPFRDQC